MPWPHLFLLVWWAVELDADAIFRDTNDFGVNAFRLFTVFRLLYDRQYAVGVH